MQVVRNSGSGKWEITCTPSGGGGPYTFLWSNGDSLNHVEVSNNGVYSVTVFDQSGYSKDTVISLTTDAVFEVIGKREGDDLFVFPNPVLRSSSGMQIQLTRKP